MSMTLSEELQWRGFVNQTTLTDTKELDRKKFKLYFGVDPSADSMQVGNLAAAMMVKAFLKHGHEVTLLVGGATGMIGDPGGKDAERNLLTLEQVAENKKAISEEYKKIFGSDVRVVDNYDWFKNINYLDFLRDVGKHFSMTPLLQRDFIANRIGSEGSGISYAEFSYTLIQGYDFYYLNEKYGIDLQVCGSDQWGNSISGVELIRRKTGKEAHIYSSPLIINTSTGKKFGKSEEGAVWLEAKKTSVFKFYQFWLNIDDGGVGDYLKVFTELGKDEIARVMTEFEKNRASRLAQKTLAYEVTKLVHGKDQADKIVRITDVLFGTVAFVELNDSEIQVMREELPVVKIKADLYDMLVEAGLASSKSEARGFHAAGAISVNGQKTLPDQEILFMNGSNLLKRGKNSFAIVEKN